MEITKYIIETKRIDDDGNVNETLRLEINEDGVGNQYKMTIYDKDNDGIVLDKEDIKVLIKFLEDNKIENKEENK